MTNKSVATKNVQTTDSDIDSKLNGLPTKSAKIRFLNSLGWKVSVICKKLTYSDGRNLRPQHVYNVLKTPLASSK